MFLVYGNVAIYHTVASVFKQVKKCSIQRTIKTQKSTINYIEKTCMYKSIDKLCEITPLFLIVKWPTYKISYIHVRPK